MRIQNRWKLWSEWREFELTDPCLPKTVLYQAELHSDIWKDRFYTWRLKTAQAVGGGSVAGETADTAVRRHCDSDPFEALELGTQQTGRITRERLC